MEQIQDFLESKLTGKIRKGALLLQKKPSPEFEQLVYSCLKKELDTNKSWETQSELIKAAGLCNYKSIIQLIMPIVDRNEEYDMVTISTGLTFFRLQRRDLKDIEPLRAKLSTIKYSLGYGMLDAIGYDRMLLAELDIKELISHFWDFGRNRPRGYVDPRYGLAAACAGWEPAIVKPFLQHCITTGDAPLKYVAENSLKQKYVKLR
ncbi:MAG TPA: hypothetical protein VL021_07745 [Brumimicrobium sp.]|nr:hypothetical protein [Brumimicrobium sp.]